MSYHNTTDECGLQLQIFEKKAEKQESQILAYFTADYGKRRYTPSEVQMLIMPSVPLTSVRRAITDLTQSGFLRKTEAKRKGPFGRQEHVWELKR